MKSSVSNSLVQCCNMMLSVSACKGGVDCGDEDTLLNATKEEY